MLFFSIFNCEVPLAELCLKRVPHKFCRISIIISITNNVNQQAVNFIISLSLCSLSLCVLGNLHKLLEQDSVQAGCPSWCPVNRITALKVQTEWYYRNRIKCSTDQQCMVTQSQSRQFPQLNQSINQSINQSFNQSIIQSINQSINQSFIQSIIQSINQSIIHSIWAVLSAWRQSSG